MVAGTLGNVRESCGEGLKILTQGTTGNVGVYLANCVHYQAGWSQSRRNWM